MVNHSTHGYNIYIVPIFINFFMIKNINNKNLIYFYDKDIEKNVLGVSITVGSINDKKNQEGITHIVEHCISRILKDRLGKHVEIKTLTYKERTYYEIVFNKLTKKTLEEVFNIFSFDLKTMLEIKNYLNIEKRVVLEEISYEENDYFKNFFNKSNEKILKKTNFAINTLGKRESIKKIKQEDIKCFIEENYIRDNIFFVVYSSIYGSEIKNKYREKYKNNFSKKIVSLQKTDIEKVLNIKNKKIKIDGKINFCSLIYIISNKKREDKTKIMFISSILNDLFVEKIRRETGYSYDVEVATTFFNNFSIMDFNSSFSTNYKKITEIFINILKNFKMDKNVFDNKKKEIINSLKRTNSNAKSFVSYVSYGIISSNEFIYPNEEIEFLQKLKANDLKRFFDKNIKKNTPFILYSTKKY